MQLAFQQFQPPRDEENTTDSQLQTLIILHGLFGTKRNWQSIAKKLSDKYQVFTLDLRNHGESVHSDIMDYESMANDVMEFINDHALSSVSLIGHSMGGKVAMQLALTKPQLVERLVVIDIAPVDYQHGFSELIHSMMELPLEKVSNREDASERLKNSIQPESLRQFLLQNLQKIDGQFQWRINLKTLQFQIDKIMGFPPAETHTPYKNRVLFLKGETSDYIKQQHERRIYKMFPNALFITVEGAGHWLHAEKPGFVVQEIKKFIK